MSILSTIAEGGQTWAHRMRMLRQLIRIAFVAALLIGIAVFAIEIYKTDRTIILGSWYHLKAKVFGNFSEKIEVEKSFWLKISREIHAKNPRVPSGRVERATKPLFDRLLVHSRSILKKTSIVSFLGVSGFFLFFLLKGGRSKRKHHVSGRKIISPRLLSWRLRLKRQASAIQIGKLPLVKGTETQHILITGGTGSGKTNCIHHVLGQIQKTKKKALIVDTTGVFVERYFDPNKDILLNPFDPRGAPWHPWVECQNNSDFEELA
ncbi:MAG: type IV secretion system DNA-binding domain-containing protein, partial [Waddliaceae bacterium]